MKYPTILSALTRRLRHRILTGPSSAAANPLLTGKVPMFPLHLTDPFAAALRTASHRPRLSETSFCSYSFCSSILSIYLSFMNFKKKLTLFYPTKSHSVNRRSYDFRETSPDACDFSKEGRKVTRTPPKATGRNAIMVFRLSQPPHPVLCRVSDCA